MVCCKNVPLNRSYNFRFRKGFWSNFVKSLYLINNNFQTFVFKSLFTLSQKTWVSTAIIKRRYTSKSQVSATLTQKTGNCTWGFQTGPTAATIVPLEESNVPINKYRQTPHSGINLQGHPSTHPSITWKIPEHTKACLFCLYQYIFPFLHPLRHFHTT